MLACFGEHFLRWGFWKKAIPPYKKEFFQVLYERAGGSFKRRSLCYTSA